MVHSAANHGKWAIKAPVFCGLLVLACAATASAQSPPTKKGAPYCATLAFEYAQRTTTSRICRDSQGRTRREYFVGRNDRGEQLESPVVIEIFDPIEGVEYTFDSVQRVAQRTVVARHLTLPPGPKQTDSVIAPNDPSPDPPLLLDLENVNEDLGSEVIDGLLVEGTRRTDPSNYEVDETWFSPELGEVILRERSRPVAGQWKTERLTGIDRSEPNPSLFRVPADYTVEDIPGSQPAR